MSDGSARVAQFDYDRIWSEVYGDIQHFGPVHRHLRRIVRRMLRPLTYASVLDVGCGDGHNVEMVAADHEVSRYVGADISSAAIERFCQRLPSAEACRLDVQEQALAEQFDLVFCSLVLEHLPRDREALLHMRKMTKSHLFLVTIAGDFERYRAWEETQGHVRNYRPGELERKVTDAGFEVIETVYWGFPFYSPFARWLQNLCRTSAQAEFGLVTRIAAYTLYWAYFLNSRRKGDVVFLLAK